jgi:hypothetical protein
VLLSKHARSRFQHPFLEPTRFHEIALVPERRGKIVHGRQRIRMLLAQHARAHL